MKNISKLIPAAYFKAHKDDGTLIWGEECVSTTNDFEEDDYMGVALVRLSDVAALSEVECENCNQLVRALREAVEGPTFMGEPVFTPPSGAAVKAEPFGYVDAFDVFFRQRPPRFKVTPVYATPQPPTTEPGQTHSDDLAVDRFAAALKDKLARQREKGYSGWETCPVERLQEYLFRHVHKGDPVDVGNFAMMLWNRGNPTAYEDQWVFDLTGKWPGIAAGQTNEQGRAADGAVPECQNCNQLVRALREATESPTFMGEPVSQLPSASNWVWQHTKSKGEYRLLGDAKIQTDIPLNDLFDVRVYQDDDGALWVRPTTEFNSKFKRLRPATQPPSASPVAVPTRDQLIELISEHLTATYHCTRVWEAWNVGTMTQDDFKDARESDLPFELADAILATQPALPDAGLDSQKGGV